jgi:hypothetical protein
VSIASGDAVPQVQREPVVELAPNGASGSARPRWSRASLVEPHKHQLVRKRDDLACEGRVRQRGGHEPLTADIGSRCEAPTQTVDGADARVLGEFLNDRGGQRRFAEKRA